VISYLLSALAGVVMAVLFLALMEWMRRREDEKW
jgi:hypothetical protein